MFKEGIIETHLNLKHIKSEPSIRKFTSDDLFQIGKEGVNNGLENVGIHGMKCAIELAQNEFKMNETDKDYLNLWLEEEVPIDLPALEKHYKQTVERQSISCNRLQSFWRKDSLITHIFFELWLITLLCIVSVFLTQTLLNS